MQRLNYHHLLYFWTVAREGSVVRASMSLSLTQPTISGQIRALEVALGEKLFERSGRRLVLTNVGRLVYKYAEEIFGLGNELLDTLAGRPAGQPPRLVVGVEGVMPKSIVRAIVEPALASPEGVRLVCVEDRTERLLAALSLREIDLVLSDAPVVPGGGVRAFNHVLGECPVALFGTRALVSKLRKRFPASLNDAPLLLPTENTVLRRSLDQFFVANGIRPRIVAEIEDGALLEALGESGAGVFPAPSIVEGDLGKRAGVVVLGRLDAVRVRLHAISLERKLKHPAVAAIAEHARTRVFGAGEAAST